MNQPRTRIRSVIVNAALKTMLILFGVMFVCSFAYALFVSLTSDKLQATQMITPTMVFTISFVLGWLIAKKHPRHTIALLFLVMAYSLAVAMIAVAIGDLTESLSTPDAALINSVALTLGNILWTPAVAFPLLLMPLYFPTGKLLSPRWRPLVIFVVSVLTWNAIMVALRPWPWSGMPDTRPINGIPGSEPFFVATTTVVTILFVLALPFFPVAVFLRYRRSEGIERIQMKWPLTALVLGLLWTVIVVVLPEVAAINAKLGYPFIWGLSQLFPISLGIAILRHRLFDIDIILNRTLVYGSLTALIAIIYVVIVGALGALFQAQTNALNGLVAAAIIAVLFQPVRDRLRRAVNRLLYGERDEPYRVLTRLGQRLEAAVEPAFALPLTVETIAQALKFPYVAVTLSHNGSVQTAAAYGASQNTLTRLPLIYAGETIGELVVGWRAPNESLTAADRQLLSDLARHIGVAAHATLLATDLEQARLRIVAAREETRRRLGSDLHDGVGHQLAGLARQVERAVHLLDLDPGTVRESLTEITHQLNAAIDEVRGLAHQLHPPELELLGFIGVLREHAQTHPSLMIHLDAPDCPPSLPTAVETAAYYILLEALTNIEKHARARMCSIRVALTPGGSMFDAPMLELDIQDDGQGLPDTQPQGLGLLSMQARAVEVGGVCCFESKPHQGTKVSVRLPCSAPLSPNVETTER